jgi:hypothetical protein
MIAVYLTLGVFTGILLSFLTFAKISRKSSFNCYPAFQTPVGAVPILESNSIVSVTGHVGDKQIPIKVTRKDGWSCLPIFRPLHFGLDFVEASIRGDGVTSTKKYEANDYVDLQDLYSALAARLAEIHAKLAPLEDLD